jgi:hypothetical protein
MSTIYIVRGETGQYDDLYNWDVCAYRDELAARGRIDNLNGLVEMFKKSCGPCDDHDLRRCLEDKMQNFDPQFEYSCGRARYYYTPVELKI